jgi:hypothetical protein
MAKQGENEEPKKLHDERVVDGLVNLQAIVGKIMDRYAVAANARIVQLLDGLRGKGANGEKPATISKSKAKAMLGELRDLKVKPEKGRGKDLYRIERLLEDLDDIFRGK